MEYFVQQFVNALAFGSELALLALGLAVVYSIMRLLNFAHGEVISTAGYSVLFAMSLGLSAPWLAVLIPVIAAALISLLLERVAFRPVRNAPTTTGMLTAFGVSIMMQNLLQLLVSARPQAMPLLNGLSTTWYVGPYAIASLQVLELIAAIVSIGALVLFLNHSILGIAMRAASRDFAMVRLMGIKANRVIAIAFAISGMLAGVATVFILARRGGVAPDMGFALVLKAFVACVIGGSGRSPARRSAACCSASSKSACWWRCRRNMAGCATR